MKRNIDWSDLAMLYKEVLEDMIFQFGYRGIKNKKPVIHTAGFSALERAFKALNWDDPHYLPEEGYTCEVVGCMEKDTAGTHFGILRGNSKLYLRLCSFHYRLSCCALPLPPIKQYALDREAKRDSMLK